MTDLHLAAAEEATTLVGAIGTRATMLVQAVGTEERAQEPQAGRDEHKRLQRMPLVANGTTGQAMPGERATTMIAAVEVGKRTKGSKEGERQDELPEEEDVKGEEQEERRKHRSHGHHVRVDQTTTGDTGLALDTLMEEPAGERERHHSADERREAEEDTEDAGEDHVFSFWTFWTFSQWHW